MKKDKPSLLWVDSYLLHSTASTLTKLMRKVQKDIRRRAWELETEETANTARTSKHARRRFEAQALWQKNYYLRMVSNFQTLTVAHPTCLRTQQQQIPSQKQKIELPRAVSSDLLIGKDKRSLPRLVSHLLHSASSAHAHHVRNAQKDTRRRDWKQETPKKIAKQNCYSNFSVLTYKVCPFHLLCCGCFSDSWARRRAAWSFCFL